ncbi:dihydrolipoyllysine-residue acetyltransferase component of pyruvate dehydrogenase complex, mitochondrial-like [Clavelina lepadiformis]|uniref:dihydrolipoyllysine-residue acetyltransferase component of pyruvate dehydrogenase complex, mitochondrial-like n=1 Tax=Clavelina lepadiformis TaxID=159417 RepID=UPI004042C2BE
MLRCALSHQIGNHCASLKAGAKFVVHHQNGRVLTAFSVGFHSKPSNFNDVTKKFSFLAPNCQKNFMLQAKSNHKPQYRLYSLPPHTKMLLPALSPTMETGTIVRWEIKEGDSFSAGDLLADIETDKATMGFEAADEGFIAKIILPEGTKDIPVGTLVAISVDSDEDIAAFKDVSVDKLKDSASSTVEQTSAPSSDAAAPSVASNVDYPPHETVTLPALSPTMTTGTIVSWEKQEGDKIEEGDSIAMIETDKASMEMEILEEGYLAKILLPEGSKDIPLGTPLCIVVTNKEDIPAFANYVDTGGSPVAAPTSTLSAPTEPQGVSPPIPVAQSPVTSSTPAGDRIFVSPLARKLAAEKGINLAQLAGLGSGPGGRIRAQDLSKAAELPAVPVQPVVTPAAAASAAPTLTEEGYVDTPLSNIRKVTAQRLHESKSTIPHYYLTIDIEMDSTLSLRKSFNSDLEKEGIKLSVNDFIIKAAALSCIKVPEANSSWRETFIRKFNKVDMSIAVSTDSGLITPIVFDAHAKGLTSISDDVMTLAAKARDGKLKPQEFQGGTFTISNLGMFGVKHFSAIINPPQACILAVGAARRELLPDANAENGLRPATLMSVTLSCDHRVVDGAVGAQWLQHFKKYLENPTKMLL